MATTTPTNVDDLEAMIRPLVADLHEPLWLPVSLFTMQDKRVAICARPERPGRITVTDGGDTITTISDMGLEIEERSALVRDIRMLAARRGFSFDGHSFSRVVSEDEVPTAALHLAEIEIAVSGLLQVRYMAPAMQVFATRARKVLQEKLKPLVLERVKFHAHYTGPFRDGDFFCVAEAKRPIGVKLVTDNENMKDAVIAAMLFKGDAITLAALRKPNIRLTGLRVTQFNTYYAKNMYNKAEALAEFINERVA